KHLRGLTSATVLTPGDAVYDANGKQVGEVRRSGLSPRKGPIAIAMIRRELPLGSEVNVGAPGHGTSARIRALSFQAMPDLDAGAKKRGAP
ncbi:MAG: glycine cleavage T C-terminal barrel domain-containing protein, partial [Gemmatimonadaceae bacterium]